MKDVKQLYADIIKNKDLFNELSNAKKNDNVDEFLKKHGYDVTLEELADFIEHTKPMVAGGKIGYSSYDVLETGPFCVDKVSCPIKKADGIDSTMIYENCKHAGEILIKGIPVSLVCGMDINKYLDLIGYPE